MTLLSDAAHHDDAHRHILHHATPHQDASDHAVDSVDELAATRAQNEQLHDELAQAQALIANLHLALESRGQIGAAIGIVMARARLTYDEAWKVLIRFSQRSNRKLRAVADDVLLTGDLSELLPAPASRH